MGFDTSFNMLDDGYEISEFELQSHYYNSFQTNILGKGMNPIILSAMS